ncbi:MAG: hypothetical protein II395_02550, partial [Ruminococcus sp.]|nr:hypothetical protein [Ruminococcus sp.]
KSPILSGFFPFQNRDIFVTKRRCKSVISQFFGNRTSVKRKSTSDQFKRRKRPPTPNRLEISGWLFLYISKAEAQLMKELITAKNQEVYHQSPKEFCVAAFDDGIEIGGIQ